MLCIEHLQGLKKFPLQSCKEVLSKLDWHFYSREREKYSNLLKQLDV